MNPTFLPYLDDLDWNDLAGLSRAAHVAFSELTSDNWAPLAKLLGDLPGDPQLVEMCESYDFLDKLVLHDAPGRFRIRLHRFRPGYFDRPHNHRWTFASKILAGSYQHTLYGADTGFTTADPADLQPLQIRTERADDWYVLHHTAVHSVTAEAGTLSLVLRGPAAKDSFRVIDAPTGESFTALGSRDETPQQRADKRMTPDRLTGTIADILTARPA
ncbi:hypothetical protein [Streptomyces sp. NRRL WC-3742]|uniref:hypothetical protein n=1 Tax=Streptomyces sp. NRRL WC-3742 TaxID=1463934 RepID=UPI000569C94E|nr:hypothetical protein [Streptomyces sp. NRRL WC-3742]